eukprot:TRINITY_DN3122_c0_g1_i4.p1 TRINITY_DN3122_c0_g1~~TRINITY_DN3122_c0_g1_i4.p1  ORF type:complete len:195 (-),score=71.58 TRINITY_DN3122_c0_g1_i4:309-836(-)
MAQAKRGVMKRVADKKRKPVAQAKKPAKKQAKKEVKKAASPVKRVAPKKKVETKAEKTNKQELPPLPQAALRDFADIIKRMKTKEEDELVAPEKQLHSTKLKKLAKKTTFRTARPHEVIVVYNTESPITAVAVTANRQAQEFLEEQLYGDRIRRESQHALVQRMASPASPEKKQC